MTWWNIQVWHFRWLCISEWGILIRIILDRWARTSRPYFTYCSLYCFLQGIFTINQWFIPQIMEVKSFYIWLVLVTLVDALTLWLLYRFNNIQAGFFLYSGCCFSGVLYYYFSSRQDILYVSWSKQVYSFLWVWFFLKLVLTLIIVLTYDKFVTKVYLHHIVTFLVSYLYFTFYEVYFMSQTSKMET